MPLERKAYVSKPRSVTKRIIGLSNANQFREDGDWILLVWRTIMPKVNAEERDRRMQFERKKKEERNK